MGKEIAAEVVPFVCVAGGPSLTLAQVRYLGMARAAGRCRVIAVNDAVYPCWFADVCFAADSDWWGEHASLPEFHGHRASIQHDRKKHPSADIALYDWDRSEGFSKQDGALTSGGNSGHSAVHLAASAGAKEIILMAYDFSADPSGSVVEHWFGRHKGRLYKEHPGRVENRLIALKKLTDALEGRGITVWNASLQSAVNWLPRFDIADLAKGIAGE